MNAIEMLVLFILVAVILFSSRKWATVGMVAGVLYLTQNVGFKVIGVNLYAVRILEVVGFIRIMIRNELSLIKLNHIDKSFLLLYLYTTTVFLLRSMEGQTYQIGITVDAILCYFTFRGLLENINGFRWFLRIFVIFLIPYLIFLFIERLTAYNLLMGETAVMFRNGTPRCVGSFRHPDLLGTLGVSFFPLYIGLALIKEDRIYALVGVAICSGIVFMTNSGAPATAAAIGVAGWLFWKIRTRMAFVRASMLGLISVLALIMKAPIWYLPAKVSDITGGGGWHRSYLMDVAFHNIDKWWLAGMPIEKTKYWFAYNLTNTGGADITNQFISFGLTAGIVAIILLIILLYRGFSSIGHSLLIANRQEDRYLLWGLGVMLCVHAFNWFAVTYYDQIYVVWFMQLACISTFTSSYLEAPRHQFSNSIYREGKKQMTKHVP